LAPEALPFQIFWSAAAIPAVTVRVQSTANALVMVPVLSSLLLPHDSEEPFPIEWPSDEAWPSHAWNPNWLLRHITAIATSNLQGKYVDTRLRSRIGHHKKAELQMGDQAVLIEKCGSDRPAFLIEIETSDGEWVEKSHGYTAMGLPRQHDEQLSCLFRTFDHSIAAHILHAATDFLQLGMKDVSVSCISASEDPNAQQQMMAGFMAELHKVAAVQAPPDTHIGHLPDIPRSTLLRASAAVKVDDALGFVELAVRADK
jgi:hypothetical protein